MELVVERALNDTCRLADKDFVGACLEGDILEFGKGRFFIQDVLELENSLDDDKLRLINNLINTAYSLGFSDCEWLG